MKYSKYNIFIMKKDKQGFYLFNTNTGSTFLVDESTKEKIEKNNIDFLSVEKKKEYENAGILVAEHINEDKIFEYFYNKSKFHNDVLALTILLTYDCNLRCVYCYEGAGETNKGSLTEESKESIYKFIVKQLESRGSKVLSLVLFGGEPLLDFNKNIEWLDNIKRYCDENDKIFVTTVITNGILMNQNIMDKLKEYNCETVQITIDGVKEIHDTRRVYKNKMGSFDEVVAGIKLIYNNPKLNNPVIRINIDKTNINNIKELLIYLEQEELTKCFIDFGIVKGTTKACSAYTGNCFVDEELGDILDELWEELRCLGFHYSIQPMKKYLFCGLYNDASYTISPFAEVYKCWDHVGMEEHKMGILNIDGDIIDVKYSYFDWMSHNPLQIDDCRNCAYLPACGGGCGAVSYSTTESYHSKGCFKTKGVIEKQIERLFMDKVLKE